MTTSAEHGSSSWERILNTRWFNPIGSMGLVYLPTFGWFFMVNVGEHASPMDQKWESKWPDFIIFYPRILAGHLMNHWFWVREIQSIHHPQKGHQKNCQRYTPNKYINFIRMYTWCWFFKGTIERVQHPPFCPYDINMVNFCGSVWQSPLLKRSVFWGGKTQVAEELVKRLDPLRGLSQITGRIHERVETTLTKNI